MMAPTAGSAACDDYYLWKVPGSGWVYVKEYRCCCCCSGRWKWPQKGRVNILWQVLENKRIKNRLVIELIEAKPGLSLYTKEKFK